jgi:hypothetical protein
MDPGWAQLLVAFVGGSLVTAAITAFLKNWVFHPVISVLFLGERSGSYGPMTIYQWDNEHRPIGSFSARYLRLKVRIAPAREPRGARPANSARRAAAGGPLLLGGHDQVRTDIPLRPDRDAARAAAVASLCPCLRRDRGSAPRPLDSEQFRPAPRTSGPRFDSLCCTGYFHGRPHMSERVVEVGQGWASDIIGVATGIGLYSVLFSLVTFLCLYFPA